MESQLQPSWIQQQLESDSTHIQQRYFTPSEISKHKKPNECWVSFLGKVYDLSKLINEHRAEHPELIRPIIEAAGTDISHWFDPKTGNPVSSVHPDTCLPVAYTPQGSYVHVPPPFPRSDFDSSYESPWWNDEQYCIGWLTKRPRKIRLINNLTKQDDEMEVASEETIIEILRRYLEYNAHASSYTWKRQGVALDMGKTLDENGIVDETDEYEKHGLSDALYVPAIDLHFKDDLTVA